MTDKKMTTRDFLTFVLKGELSDEVLAKALEMIAKLDETNAKRKNTPKKRKVSSENVAIMGAIMSYLQSQTSPALAKDIAIAIGESVQKTSAMLRSLADDEQVSRFVPENRNKPIEYSALIVDEGEEEEEEEEDSAE